MAGAKLCRACGVMITGDWPGEWHVGCYPDFEIMPGFDMTSFDLEIKHDLDSVIRWADNSRGRSTQVALGVSEVGQECELKLAYRMAAMPAVHNGGDPWPAIVGTAIHAWVEQAVNDYQAIHGISQWFTEMEVFPSPLVMGHTDLYHRDGLVLDLKFPSADNLRKMKADGPSIQYVTQVQLYGLGHEKAGRPVTRVGIVAAGRQGWLKDLWVHTIPYDRDYALAALQRIYDIGEKMISLDLPESGAWHEIERSPTRLCTWCPHWNRNETVPSARGCPGK